MSAWTIFRMLATMLVPCPKRSGFLITATPDWLHLLAPFAALFLPNNVRSGHNGSGRKCEQHNPQNLGRGSLEQLYPRGRSCFEHRGLRNTAGALHKVRNRLAYRRLRHLWKHSYLPLLGVDPLPWHPAAATEAPLENLRPLGDLSADCWHLHTI